MRNERGQSLLLVLIILAVGTLVIVPALWLTYTSLESTRIINRHIKGLYVGEAAQEMIIWLLYYGGLADNMTYDGDSVSLTIDVCDAEVNALITMRAVEAEGGVELAGTHTIMPTKTVDRPVVPNDDPGPYEYTIALTQVSSNVTNKLEVVYDILPPAFTKFFDNVYEENSSYTSIDGIEWTQIPDPSYEEYAQQVRLRWPSSGNFTDLSFKQFEPGDVHYLRFIVKKPVTIQNDVACNWVVLQVGDVLTVSGPQAPLVVGTPIDPEGCANDGLFEVWKTSDPEIIPPLQPTLVTYTIHVTNMAGSIKRIGSIRDILPPGFTYKEEEAVTYVNGVSGNISAAYPDISMFNGMERQYIDWISGPGEQLGADGMQLAAGDNATIDFRAWAVPDVSGSYYNEVIVSPSSMPASYSIFTDLGLGLQDVGQMYSWKSGIVIVPAYDTETETEGGNITASFGLDPDGIKINSWHFK